MKSFNLLLLFLCFFGMVCVAQNKSTALYQPNWKSLSKHQTPEWFRDAKFGIYTHWGPNTVADENAPNDEAQWFGMRMYVKSNPVFGYSKETFGDQHQFGYKDFIPMFKGEKFDAKAWAQLFEDAGAKFAGPVAIHHDNFAMWDSKLTKWNSMQMGPHKDIVGELEKEIKARHMYFMTSFHHAYAWQYYDAAFEYDAADTAYAGLYTMPHKPKTPESEPFKKLWLDKIKEVVTKYKPSLIWFDMDFNDNLLDIDRQKMFAFYYNWANKNNIKGVVTQKGDDVHKYTGVLDFERGKEDKITSYPWLTDDSMKGDSWFYQKSDTSWKSPNELINFLSDIVSKNGNLLLNVDPMSDGSFNPRTVSTLKSVGKWLKANGESIYNTRPWVTYGEGTENGIGSVRYTRSKDNKTIYAIVLNGSNNDRHIVDLKSITKEKYKIKSIEVINSNTQANWKWANGHPQLKMPEQNLQPEIKAVAFKIKLN
ncbi:alpha-L-fucosidase [Pedobacter changchengzhani]|uniref:alpha-L-fucosidase n=1 Tax=Pedobacter changchengzhani TaxID=2529274 RepID=A0A4V6PJ88_9SPHI|nr:alpha-L-fucosidase [Pedobacter changchengzhani]TDG36233.1 alpha-L-fucosidase [Pedobacter changchengzhani]